MILFSFTIFVLILRFSDYSRQLGWVWKQCYTWWSWRESKRASNLITAHKRVDEWYWPLRNVWFNVKPFYCQIMFGFVFFLYACSFCLCSFVFEYCNRQPSKNYQFKSTQTIKRWELCWKSTLKIPERSYWHLLTSLLTTLNLFHPFFSCFWCWLWTGKFLLWEK